MKKILGLMLVMFMFAGCSKDADESFLGQQYESSSFGFPVSIVFDKAEGKVSGKVVNRYMGTYTLNGENIKFGPLASTMMMGIDGNGMRAEKEYFKFMSEDMVFELDDDELVLTTSAGEKAVFKRIQSK